MSVPEQQDGGQAHELPPHVESKQFHIGFATDPVDGSIAILIREPWEQKFRLYRVKGTLLQKLMFTYSLEQIEVAERTMQAMAERAKLKEEMNRRASKPTRKIDASGNIVEEAVQQLEEIVDAEYEVVEETPTTE